MSGYTKSKKTLESQPLTKGEKAHARRIAANPDFQPELKTLPPVFGENAAVSNALPKAKMNPVVEKEEELRKAKPGNKVREGPESVKGA